LGWAAYHRAAGNVDLVRQHAEQALDAASAPRQPLALLAAHRALGEVTTAGKRYAEAQAHLDQSLALVESCAAPYERALTLLAMAELRMAEGKPGEATAALSDARAALERLSAAPALARADALATSLAATPHLAAPATLPFGLTAREVDVLKLLAEGLTDPQIAERLFVSRNTVATHTRAIFGKLGVTTRAAAARLAAEHGLA
jgi:DNA-binding NarL/FixJ family response regulator